MLVNGDKMLLIKPKTIWYWQRNTGCRLQRMVCFGECRSVTQEGTRWDTVLLYIRAGTQTLRAEVTHVFHSWTDTVITIFHTRIMATIYHLSFSHSPIRHSNNIFPLTRTWISTISKRQPASQLAALTSNTRPTKTLYIQLLPFPSPELSHNWLLPCTLTIPSAKIKSYRFI
jgi:hypothetical protein